ncbi:kinesin-like protein [Trypanosoma theileri]|uniref:Kinesin-like protein n=1 Tax=Trypanosoma theileri TaxID=67003 RepID=A0A1X0P435_9TRYP|nr:kinesin-like protein [Trypanosoma theileri]ORC91329.1 kinesin-like protein [Trypanosoma theileri]
MSATKANVFVRVRPFTEAEATVCPEDSPVPREVLEWNGTHTLTVLDAVNGFVPRKNGQFEIDNVLWSFRDEERPQRVVHTQKDVYDKMVTPIFPQLVEGYSAAFCVTGATGSGRIYSLYGDDVDGINRGILPRFADDVFTAFKREKRENSTLSCEVEAIDIAPNETYVDLLSQRRKSPVSGTTEEMKLVNDAVEGMKLQGATRVPVNKPAELNAVLRQLARVVPKRSGCHTVNLRFVETYEFEDPEQLGQAVSKARRINVLFVLLRNMPAAFQRCVDVAVEHDSGENPLAKVPTRETAFTKLYPELFQQGYNLSFLCCVSPFYEHTRETMQTLVLATKFMKLRCKPKLMQDEALVELRNLSDEVKNLKTEMVRQSESTQIVQTEINAREVELMKQEAVNHSCRVKLHKSEYDLAAARHARALNRYRTKWHKANYEKIVHDKKKMMAAMMKEREATEKVAAEEGKVLEKAGEKVKMMEQKIKEQSEKNASFEARLKDIKEKGDKVEEMNKFISSTPEEQRCFVLEAAAKRNKEAADADNERLKKEMKEITEMKDKAAHRCQAMEKEYSTVYAAEKGTRDKEEMTKSIVQLQKEIAEMETENRRLQNELDRHPPGCQCLLM